MTAQLLAFPGIDPGRIRPRPFAGMAEGGKALVVIPEGDHFAVVVRPALTRAELDVRQSFPTARAALGYADKMTQRVPALYQRVLDYSTWGAL